LIIIPCLIVACREEPERITPDMRRQIDTLYKNQVPVLKAEMDSLCDLRFDKMVNEMKDSIMIERLEERKKKLGY